MLSEGRYIETDCCGGHYDFNALGYNPTTVNNSENYFDPDTWTHTQEIKRAWATIKAPIKRAR